MEYSYLKGDKVELRAIEPEDIDLLLKWENDIDNWHVSGTISPYSRNILKQYIENAHLDIYKMGQLRLMIMDRMTGETIGTVDLFDFDAFHQRAGIGILIGNAEKRANGYASQTLTLIKSYCFDHLNLQQLYCNILTDNKISLQLFKKAGFSINGTCHKWVRCGNEYKDQHFLQLLKKEG